MNFTEKRKMERFPLKLPALISMMDENENQRAFEVMISNICAGGAFFKTYNPLSLGTDMKMELILPLDKFKKFGSKRSRVDVSGLVIRTNDQGMAVRFDKNFQISPLNN
ncbi:MAG: PilZ domain-containing protein [Thermodesulfobacteriota bacterium]|nr:PilZ domain-containing protein [Thermodesulfobacteriota bacterium]